MPELTRRRSAEAREECWHVYYGDVHAIPSVTLIGTGPRLRKISGGAFCHASSPLLRRLASMIDGRERYFGGLFLTSLSISRHVSNST
jgi:hypothetical protein